MNELLINCLFIGMGILSVISRNRADLSSKSIRSLEQNLQFWEILFDKNLHPLIISAFLIFRLQLRRFKVQVKLGTTYGSQNIKKKTKLLASKLIVKQHFPESWLLCQT